MSGWKDVDIEKSIAWTNEVEIIDITKKDWKKLKIPKIKNVKKFKTNRKFYLATYEGIVKKAYEEFKNK
jgi:hypothetical protein